MQNTFLRAFRALDRGVVPQNEVAWLFKIAHNVCLSSKLAWLRRRRVETPRDLDDLSVTPIARESRRDELVGLEDALASLPPRLREALLLREWQGLSYAEIADRLDTSRSAVETLIFRARRALAAELEAPARRLRQALGIGPALGWLRGLLTGGSLALKAAGVVAVVAGATIAAKPLYAPSHHHSAPTSTPTTAVAHRHSQAAHGAGPATAQPARKAHRRGKTTAPAPPGGSPASAPGSSSSSAGSAATQAPAAASSSSSSASRSNGSTPLTPGTSLPGVTPPPTSSLPSTTLPSTTLPSTTLPSTTLPSTTLPSTTLPSTTLPSTPSLPPTPTVPSVSVPAAPPTPPLQSTPTVPAQTTPLP